MVPYPHAEVESSLKLCVYVALYMYLLIGGDRHQEEKTESISPAQIIKAWAAGCDKVFESKRAGGQPKFGT